MKVQRTPGILTFAGILLRGATEVKEGSLPPVPYCSENGTQRLGNVLSLIPYLLPLTTSVFKMGDLWSGLRKEEA